MTYDYMCDSCKHEFQLEQAITDKPAKKCPKCKRMSARRMISSGGGFVLKGSGWFKDGY